MGAALLKPHLSYLRALEGLLDSGVIKGLAHITGGGLLENIPRILPEGTSVEIKRGSWPVLPIFELMQRIGNMDEAEMFRTFNMGVGMVIVGASQMPRRSRIILNQTAGPVMEIRRGRERRTEKSASFVSKRKVGKWINGSKISNRQLTLRPPA